ncbi:MAG: hydroxyethylthiazole kinase [Rickettsiales bacterium]|jgi:hydroxyethylthiazole kinase|nr:hydroxyethylthiazole kinase [Rickettsiales bacterium]
MIDEIENSLENLHKIKPLVLNLTNSVTMDFVANSLLALGAAPIMSEDIREMEELIQISSAVYINIGTLTVEFIERAKFACITAKKYNKAVILDPVGVGATVIRKKTVKEILPFIDIIRGNASEIMAVYGLEAMGLGVESTHQVNDALESAKELALRQDITVVVSGSQDFITDGKREEILSFGSKVMPFITGMGCSLTAVIAAFRALNSDSFESAKLAVAYFSLSGQIAEGSARGSGSFRVEFIDCLNKPNWNKMRELL